MTWELLTIGMVPYVEFAHDNDVIAHVRGGGRLPDPDGADVAFIWAAVQRCFCKRAKDRPTFSELSIVLGQLRGPPKAVLGDRHINVSNGEKRSSLCLPLCVIAR